METKIKGITTGVKGGIPIKTDYKGTLEIKYLSVAKYDKDNTLKDIVEHYEKALNEQEQAFNDKINKLSIQHKKELKTLKLDFENKQKAYENKVDRILKQTLEVMQYGI